MAVDIDFKFTRSIKMFPIRDLDFIRFTASERIKQFKLVFKYIVKV